MRSDQFAVIKHFVLAAETDFFFFLTEEIRAVLEETLMVNSVREDSVVLKRTTFFFFFFFFFFFLSFLHIKVAFLDEKNFAFFGTRFRPALLASTRFP